MRKASVTRSAWKSPRAVAERWAQQEPRERANLVYQAATLAVVALLLITAI